MEERITYYNYPTQVAFWEPDGLCYAGGIAYRDEIICGCCGGIIELSDIYDSAPEGVRAVVEYRDWMSLEDYILDDNERCFEMEAEA